MRNAVSGRRVRIVGEKRENVPPGATTRDILAADGWDVCGSESGDPMEKPGPNAGLWLLDRPDAEAALRIVASLGAAETQLPVVVLLRDKDAALAHPLREAGAVEVLVESEICGLLRALRYASDRARAAGILRASWNRFRALTRHSADGISVLNGSAKVRYVNAAAAEMLGYASQHLIGKYLFDLVHGEDVARARTAFDLAVASPTRPVTCSFRAGHRTRGWREITWTFSSHIDDPDVGGVVANHVDSTERTAMAQLCATLERALGESRREIAALRSALRVLRGEAADAGAPADEMGAGLVIGMVEGEADTDEAA